jgi:hypothetical protein
LRRSAARHSNICSRECNSENSFALQQWGSIL